MFEEFGTITSAKVIKDRETGCSKGFGFVLMEGNDDVHPAIAELDGAKINSRTVKVNKAHPKRPGGIIADK